MKNVKEKIFRHTVQMITMVSVLLLIFILIFISKESLEFFKKISLIQFVIESNWNPLSEENSFSILPIILGTIYVSIVAILLALPIGVGTSIVLSSYGKNKTKILILNYSWNSNSNKNY